jgi:predicted ABC-class ATPase
MQSMENLKSKLISINGKDYGAYQSLLGSYDFRDYKLFIDQIPKDPYAPPHTGIYRIHINIDKMYVPEKLYESELQCIAYRDFFARRVFNSGQKTAGGRRGTGYSGVITIDEPGQAVLERSSVTIQDEVLEIRMFLGLPAAGRKIKAETAKSMIFNELPEIIKEALFKENIKTSELNSHINTVEDAEYLRNSLKEKGLVSFIADGSVLPRKSGTSDLPLEKEKAVLFKTPENLALEVTLPHSGTVRGMGIKTGITLITGGGYHGKSTLLHAVEAGVYNHIPGDGRERCVTNQNALKIRAFSGRYVEKVDISTFIKNLPGGGNTMEFSTENASGSTSQAAAIQEAVEAGTEILLMDEDTCATNFMIRDIKMQKLIHKTDEPITTFIDKARQLYSELGISTILVLGGMGDYFDISDEIIQMLKYEPYDVTKKAHEIAESSPVKREAEDKNLSIKPAERIPLPGSIDPLNQYNKKSIFTKEVKRINFGKTVIDLTDVEQLNELSQSKAIMNALLYAARYVDGKRTLKQILALIKEDIKEKGLDVLSERISGNLSEFRVLELACAINRMRTLKVKQ